MSITHPVPTLSRRSVIVTAGSLALGATLGTARPSSATSQAPQVPPGVVVQALCAGESSSFTGKTLQLLRITVHPEAAFIAQPGPGPVALNVERGWFDIEMLEGQGTVTRALVDGMWPAHRDLVPGDVTYLAAGDSLFHDSGAHLVHNTGDDSVEILVSTLIDTDSGLTWLEPA